MIRLKPFCMHSKCSRKILFTVLSGDNEDQAFSNQFTAVRLSDFSEICEKFQMASLKQLILSSV